MMTLDERYLKEKEVINKWVFKCASEYTHGDIAEAIMVITGTVPEAAEAILRQANREMLERVLIDLKVEDEDY